MAILQRLRLSALDCDADQDLLSLLATNTQSWLVATEVSLVHLDRARQAGPFRVGRAPNAAAAGCECAGDVFVCAANIQLAVNQTVSGVRRRSKSVPVVTGVLALKTAHL